MKNQSITKKDLNEGFENMGRMIKGGFDGMDKRLDKLEKGQRLLDQGQEEIKLRLDNVAYRFELKDLEIRVNLLEKKVGIKPSKS